MTFAQSPVKKMVMQVDSEFKEGVKRHLARDAWDSARQDILDAIDDKVVHMRDLRALLVNDRGEPRRLIMFQESIRIEMNEEAMTSFTHYDAHLCRTRSISVFEDRL